MNKGRIEYVILSKNNNVFLILCIITRLLRMEISHGEIEIEKKIDSIMILIIKRINALICK